MNNIKQFNDLMIHTAIVVYSSVQQRLGCAYVMNGVIIVDIPLLPLQFWYTTGTQMENSSPPAYYYLAELQVKQRNKKHKHTQNIYSHAVLLDYPPLEHRQPSPTQSSNSHTERQTEPESSSPSEKKQEDCSKSRGQGGIQVASFPSIISHRNLLNEKLVNRPYLTFTFILKQYRHEQE